MLESGVLGVRLDPLEARFLAGARSLELGNEDRRLAGRGRANAIGRSFERNQKPVKYWMYD